MMRVLSIMVAALLVAGGAEAKPTWKPDAKIIAALEAKLPVASKKLQLYPVKQYARYYQGITVRGRRMVQGYYEWVPPECAELNKDHAGLYCDFAKPSGVYINLAQPNGMLDGGCAAVRLMFDPTARRILWVRCNGVG